jgi:riboflavin biosynthesis pyrimidine reductase
VRRLLPSPSGELDDGALADAYRMPAGRSLRMDFVASPDGAVSVDGRSAGLGSPGDRRVFRVLRALADAVLVGAGTATAEGYRPVRPDSPVGELRATLGRPPALPIAVVTRQASLDPATPLAADRSTLVVTCAAADPGRRAALAAAGATVLVCGDDDVDLAAAVGALADRGLEQVTCEGGPQLLHAALTAGVVDELDLTIAPALVGAAHRLLPAGLTPPVALELQQLLEEDGVLFTRYRVADAPGGGS